MATNSCPAITATGHSCSASTDCTGLMCQVPSSANLSSASASIRLQSCDDPPQIHFQAQGQFANGTSFNFSYKFQESKIVFNEEAYIGANVWRNLTSLRFSVSCPPSLPPTLPPSLPPSVSPSLPPSLPPSFPPSLPPSFPPSLRPSLPPSVPPSVPSSLSLPPSLLCIVACFVCSSSHAQNHEL